MIISVDYELKLNSEKLLESIYASLTPELKSLPRDCKGYLLKRDENLAIKLECTSVGKLRALNNSFIGVLLMLLELAGEFENG